MTWAPPVHAEEATPPRVAYAIGRPVGGAVVRNRLRRRLRAVVSELAKAGQLPSGAWLIGAGPPAVEMTYEHLKASVAEALTALSNEPAR